MRVMLHGVRRIDMVDAKDGRSINGFSCFISYPSEGVQGYETAKQFISDDMASSCAWSPDVGKMLDIDFTPKGKVCRISTVHEK